MQPPSTFDQALQLAVGAALRRVDAVIQLQAAKARAAIAKGFYEDAVALNLSPDFIKKLSFRKDEAEFHLSLEREDLDPEDPGLYVWESGHLFDDQGQEFSVNVLYRPQFWNYEVVRRDERGEQELGYYPTYEAAMQGAKEAIYPMPEEAVPAPTITFEASTAAGEMVVMYRGEERTICAIVDETFRLAGEGSGQHYEIFARRAMSMLADLVRCMTTDESRQAMQDYIAYERF